MNSATTFSVSHARLFTIFDLGRNSCAYILHRFEFKTFVIIRIMTKLYSFNFSSPEHSSEGDYVITDSVRSMYVVCTLYVVCVCMW